MITTNRALVPQPEFKQEITWPKLSSSIFVDYTCIGARDKQWTPKRCEDRVVVNDAVVALIDGATSVNAADSYWGLNAAELAAQCLRRHLETKAKDYTSAKDLLISANERLQQVLQKRCASPDYNAGPSAAAAVVKIHKDMAFDIAACGDCIVCGCRYDGKWVQFTQDLLPMGRKALNEFVKPNEPGLSAEQQEERRALLADAKYRRKFLYNKHVAVANGDPDFGAIDGLLQVTPTYSFLEYPTVVVMTDGAFFPKPKVGESAAIATCKLLQQLDWSPNAVASEIFKLKNEARLVDLGGKTFDDLSLLVMQAR